MYLLYFYIILYNIICII